MGRVLLIDTSSGISSDGFVAALLDANIMQDAIECELPLLNLRGYKFVVNKETRDSASGTTVKIEARKNKVESIKYRDLKRLILDSQIGAGARRVALDIFAKLSDAEAIYRSCDKDDIEFIISGVVDSVVSIVASAICINYLNCEEIISTYPVIPLGKVDNRKKQRIIDQSVFEILKGIPVKFQSTGAGIITPAGAAILSSIARFASEIPPLSIKSRGSGFLNSKKEGNSYLTIYEAEHITRVSNFTDVMIDAIIDDLNPRFSSYLLSRLSLKGVHSVFTEQIFTGAGNVAQKINVVCEPGVMNDILGILFTEASVSAVNYNLINRVGVSSDEKIVRTEFGPVRFRLLRIGSDYVNARPEYEDIFRISIEQGIPVCEVYRIAITAYESSGEKK